MDAAVLLASLAAQRRHDRGAREIEAELRGDRVPERGRLHLGHQRRCLRAEPEGLGREGAAARHGREVRDDAGQQGGRHEAWHDDVREGIGGDGRAGECGDVEHRCAILPDAGGTQSLCGGAMRRMAVCRA